MPRGERLRLLAGPSPRLRSAPAPLISNAVMRAYLDLLRHVLEHGRFKSDRPGTGTYSVFGAQVRYSDLRTLETVDLPRVEMSFIGG